MYNVIFLERYKYYELSFKLNVAMLLHKPQK